MLDKTDKLKKFLNKLLLIVAGGVVLSVLTVLGTGAYSWYKMPQKNMDYNIQQDSVLIFHTKNINYIQEWNQRQESSITSLNDRTEDFNDALKKNDKLNNILLEHSRLTKNEIKLVREMMEKNGNDDEVYNMPKKIELKNLLPIEIDITPKNPYDYTWFAFNDSTFLYEVPKRKIVDENLTKPKSIFKRIFGKNNRK